MGAVENAGKGDAVSQPPAHYHPGFSPLVHPAGVPWQKPLSGGVKALTPQAHLAAVSVAGKSEIQSGLRVPGKKFRPVGQRQPRSVGLLRRRLLFGQPGDIQPFSRTLDDLPAVVGHMNACGDQNIGPDRQNIQPLLVIAADGVTGSQGGESLRQRLKRLGLKAPVA